MTNPISEDSLRGAACQGLILISHAYSCSPALLILRRRKKLRAIAPSGWFSHPVSTGSHRKITCTHRIAPSAHPFPSKISGQHIWLCAESTWHAFMGNPALPWHSSEILWLKSTTFFLCHGTVNIYTIIKIASTTIFFLLLSFNTFL